GHDGRSAPTARHGIDSRRLNAKTLARGRSQAGVRLPSRSTRPYTHCPSTRPSGPSTAALHACRRTSACAPAELAALNYVGALATVTVLFPDTQESRRLRSLASRSPPPAIWSGLVVVQLSATGRRSTITRRHRPGWSGARRTQRLPGPGGGMLHTRRLSRNAHTSYGVTHASVAV